MENVAEKIILHNIITYNSEKVYITNEIFLNFFNKNGIFELKKDKIGINLLRAVDLRRVFCYNEGNKAVL